jgi:hypothetical protein
MARYAAIQSGNWSAAATWARVGASSTFHASSTSSDLTGTPQFTDTFTAPNTTASAVGFIAYLTSLSQSNSTYTVTLQEYDGSTWVDKNTGTFTTTGTVSLSGDYVLFTITPYVYTTTTANRYRYKMERTGGSGGLFRARLRSAGTNWGIFALDDRGAEPVDTDTVMVCSGDPGGASLTVTVDGTRAVGNAGTTTNALDPTTQDMAILQGGQKSVVKWDTSASAQLTVKGMWSMVSGTIEMGDKTTAYPAANTAKLVWNENGTSGNYGLYTAGNSGSYIYLNGAAPTAYAVDYVSGSGTTASPLITSGDLGAVGDEIAIAATGAYGETEYKFIKTKNSATSYVLADTAGGAEAGLTYTHSTDAKVCNLQRNVIVTSTNTSHAWYFYLQASGTQHEYFFQNARYEYLGNSGVGKFGIAIGYSTGQANCQMSAFTGNVGYGSLYSTLYWYQIPTPSGATYDDNIFCRTTASSGTFGVTTISVANKTCNRWYFLDLRSAGASWGGFAACTMNDFYFAGCNTANVGNQSAMLLTGSTNQVTFNRAKFLTSRRASISMVTQNVTGLKFYDSAFAPGVDNTIDVWLVSNSYFVDALFSNCTFGSTTLVSNYLNQLSGSELRFHRYNQTANEHRWYTPQGSGRSSGAGLSETTVRTAGSLALAVLPEDATDGFSWTVKLPATPATTVFLNGYVQRNATFSSGACKVELFLPGTLLTAAPDATYTFPTTTGSWLPFNISAYYSGTESLLATVRFTGVTATAGAEFYVDDLFDAGTTNKVAGLDVWDEGKPAPVLAATDVSAVAAQVWAYPTVGLTTAGTTGKRLVDIPTTTYTVPTAAQVADAVWDEPAGDHVSAGSTGKKLGDIPTATYTVPTASEVADAVWDEPTSSHTTPGSTGKKLDDVPTATYSVPTAGQVADAVWDELTADHTSTGTTGKKLGDFTSSSAPSAATIATEVWATDIDGKEAQDRLRDTDDNAELGAIS